MSESSFICFVVLTLSLHSLTQIKIIKNFTKKKVKNLSTLFIRVNSSAFLGLITNGGGAVSGVEPLHGVGVAGMSPTSNGIVQYTNTDNGGPPFYVPSMTTLGASSGSGLGSPPDESSRYSNLKLAQWQYIEMALI